ncbi:MAG: Maf family protein, partial [Lachnospiraceae bacterium]|nr:Maf family protein [Lachnospiraceae bacterium]
FVNKIKGDFYTVMGLPKARLYEELRRRCFFRSE